MVSKILTLAALLIASPALATPPVRAVAVAQATILRPVALRIDAQAGAATLNGSTAAQARRTVRPCAPDRPQGCTLIVYDLP